MKNEKLQFIISIFKQIFSMCKNDVFYTLFFVTLSYLSLYTLLVFIGVTFIEHSDGYYVSFIICKWAVFVSSALTAYKIFKENSKLNSLFVFGGLAILYNTVIKIPFEEGQWLFLMVITALIYLHFSAIFFFAEKNKNSCSVCGSKPKFSKIYRVHIFKGGFGQGEIHFDGETYICKNCMDKCQKCDNCEQFIMSDEIKDYLGDWESLAFCSCKNNKT